MQKTKNNKLRVGIFFGGSSREREVSFAGGRTVYDNLDKELFTAIPIFVDEFGNMVELNWEYIYRGTIRDFYPPVSHLPNSPNAYQIYSESLVMSAQERRDMLSEVGEYIQPDQLADQIDLAFLALHGEHGEDGHIQGLLEWYKIPYTGSGILASAIGMNKAVQKRLMTDAGFDGPKFISVHAGEWEVSPDKVYKSVLEKVGFPLVVKSANQGSSIGVTILHHEDRGAFDRAMQTSLFQIELSQSEWEASNKVEYVRQLSDIRSSLGFPLQVDGELVYHPEDALNIFDTKFETSDTIILEAVRGEVEVVVESFIPGREFSCIVVRDDNNKVIALPPTEIVKRSELFDYKSKYLPGLSRKVTPIDLPEKEIERIRKDCEKLFNQFEFNVYARIDGFYTSDGRILLNDPNTTSGMMPSSFFFHQAAEIGLNPSQFLTFIIRKSLAERMAHVPLFALHGDLIKNIDSALEKRNQSEQGGTRIAIIMGGYSTERHISVESGRNIYEKLASSGEYIPTPIFLTGNAENHRLYKIPINVMLKDNADDIRQKVESFHRHDIMSTIGDEASHITDKYVHTEVFYEPQEITYEQMKTEFDAVFIALHGRPGEDGAVQKHLDELHIPYNGSGVASSSTTIDKFKTNNMLRDAGFLVADGALINKQEYQQNKDKALEQVLRMDFPLIAKPSDEGCSSAVKVIRNGEELEAYADLTFRAQEELEPTLASQLEVGPKEEFPQKDYFLVEQFIDRKGAKHFLEITGGMVTHMKDGQVAYEVFEPSEALAEGEILSLAEKFLAGEGQNITPARFDTNSQENERISSEVRRVLEEVARFLNVEGYCRIDAFVRIYEDGKIDVIIIEINSLPGMTPATCIYHQAAINGYKPFEFIDEILKFGQARLQRS